MTSVCSCCGKEFPIEELFFSPEAEAHIRSIATDGPEVKVSAEEMRKLYCKNCLETLRKVQK